MRPKGLEAIEHDDPLSEGSRLVEAYDIDAGEALDRRQLLHQDVPTGENDDAHAEGD